MRDDLAHQTDRWTENSSNQTYQATQWIEFKIQTINFLDFFDILYLQPSEGPVTHQDALQPGCNFVAAGYALYGSATMVVLSTGNGVNGFTLDPVSNELVWF